MRGRGFRGRRFVRRGRRVARQYRSYQQLFMNSAAEDFSLNSSTTYAALANNSVYFRSKTMGKPSVLGVQDIFNLQNDFGFTIMVPMITQLMLDEHGQEFTIRGIRGYFVPRTIGTKGVDGTPSAVKGEAIITLAIVEAQVSSDAEIIAADSQVAAVESAGGFPLARMSLFRDHDLRRRIWWMRQFIMETNSSAAFDFMGGAATNNSRVVYGPDLLRGPFSFHLPRFNFKVSRGRRPYLAIGFGGQLPGVSTAQIAATGYDSLSGLSAVIYNQYQWCRAFITR